MRKSAAIMFSDIVGYSAIMNKNEDDAFEILEKNRKIHESALTQFNGKFIKEVGDGIISSFESVSSAVDCARTILMESEKENIGIKIGINHGEVTFENNDVFGDPVNVASRLESLGIRNCILISGIVNMLLKNNTRIETISVGKFKLKNIEEPVEVFAISDDGLVIPSAKDLKGKAKPLDLDIPNNLPKLETSFIGRKKEIKTISDLLKEHKLVTLYGPGGSGKTRLAIQVAIENMQDFEDGVFFVDLAPISNDNLVVNTIAKVLMIPEEMGFSQEDTISKMISNKSYLIIVDNCEHLIDCCANLINYIINKVSKPKFLATSRELLNIQSEYSFQVPTLSVPSATGEQNEIEQAEAVQLFKDRAKMSRNDFEMDESNLQDVSSICQRLDGIPLALELAAARVNVMDSKTLLERLNNQFNILKTSDRSLVPRQKTIEATLDWSHDLLSIDEQILFSRLSIFNGDFDLVEVEEICGYDPLIPEDILDLISQLSNKSLIVSIVKKDIGVRYRLLKIMKQYGQSKLGDKKEKIERAYVDYFLELAKISFEERIKNNVVWNTRLEVEHPNVLGVLDLLKDNTVKTLELGSNISWFWYERVHPYAAREYLLPAIEKYEAEDVLKARALCGLGYIMGWNLEFEKGYQMMTEGAKILSNIGTDKEKADYYCDLAMLNVFIQNFERCNELLSEGLEISKKLKNRALEMRYNSFFCGYYTHQLKADEAEPLVSETLKEAYFFNSPFDILLNSHFNADIPLIREEYEEAEKRYQMASQQALELGNIFQSLIEMQGIAMALCGQSKYEKGIKLWGAISAKFEDMGFTPPPIHFWQVIQEKTVLKKMKEIGEEKAAKLQNLGRQMHFEKVVEYAMDSDAE